MIFRRYRQFYALHNKLEERYGAENKSNTFAFTLPVLPGRLLSNAALCLLADILGSYSNLSFS